MQEQPQLRCPIGMLCKDEEKPPVLASQVSSSQPYNLMPEVVQERDGINPYIESPNAVYRLEFYLTRDNVDVEYYRKFLDNSVSRFRKSVFYKQYKSHIMGLGLDKCQVLGITEDMAEIEMHHNFLGIYDIAFIICEHILNTVGYIDSFQLVNLLKDVHRKHQVPIVMLCKTAHQMHTNNKDFVLPSQMCFGFWHEFLREYNKGITTDIGYKIINFIDTSLYYEQNNYVEIPDKELMSVRKNILGWCDYNEYTRGLQTNLCLT